MKAMSSQLKVSAVIVVMIASLLAVPSPVVASSESPKECLIFRNISHDYNYSLPQQYTFNITAELYNTCDEGIIYPSTLILNDTAGVETSSDQNNWRYGIDANAGYNVSWQVSYSPFIPTGTIATFDLHPTSDNCSVNCTESQNSSYSLVMALGTIDISNCYGIWNYGHDYDLNNSHGSFNITATLDNHCPGSIHYPVGVLWNNTLGVESNPPEGQDNYGMSAYMIFPNTSTNISWNINLDSSIVNGTNVTFTMEPECWVYTVDSSPLSYMQDCSLTPLISRELVIQIGVPEPINQTNNNTTVVDSDGGDETITVNHVVLVDTPPHPEWEWNYSYQVEVSDLQMDVNYTAVILLKQIGNDEWEGADWWWDDIESDGDQFDHLLMLQRGCYFINASLFEKEDLNSDAENATVLATADLDFVVGTGTCVNGVYSESDDNNEQSDSDDDNEQSDSDDDNEASEEDEEKSESTPGFGLIAGISAALGAALIATRRNES